jgi:hypothetical protein
MAAGVEWLRKMSHNRGARLTAMALVLGVAIYVLVQGGAQLVAQSVRLNPPLVFLSFIISFLGLLVAILCWRLILASYGVHRPVRDDIRIYCYSSLGVVLPGGVWTIVGRSALYQRLGDSSLRVATASVTEAFVSGIAALGVYAITVIVQPDISLWQRPEIGVVFSLVVLFLIQPRIFNQLSGWILERSGQSKELLQVAFDWRALASWICLEAVVVVMGGLAMFALLLSLTVVPPAVLVQAVAAWAAAIAVSTLFFWLPGTFALRDGAMILALTPSLPLPVAFVFVLLVRIWSIAFLLIVAGLAWLTLDCPGRAKTESHNRPHYPEI